MRSPFYDGKNNNVLSNNSRPFTVILKPHNDMVSLGYVSQNAFYNNRKNEYALPYVRLQCRNTSVKFRSVCRHMADKMQVSREDVHIIDKLDKAVDANRSIGAHLHRFERVDPMTIVAHYLYLPTGGLS